MTTITCAYTAGYVSCALVITSFCVLSFSGVSESVSLQYVFERNAETGGVFKRNTVNGTTNQARIGNPDALISQVENVNARRIQTLYQLLEHRPEPRTCYNGRSDRTYRFYCPTPSPEDMENGWQCITIDDLCNNIPDCPGAEDEDLVHCMFYNAIQHQTQTLRQIIIRHYDEVHTVPNTVRT